MVWSRGECRSSVTPGRTPAWHRKYLPTVSDVLSDVEWTPDFGSPDIQRGLSLLVDAAIELIDAEARDNRAR